MFKKKKEPCFAKLLHSQITGSTKKQKTFHKHTIDFFKKNNNKLEREKKKKE